MEQNPLTQRITILTIVIPTFDKGLKLCNYAISSKLRKKFK